MSLRNRLTDYFGIHHPIVLAPMSRFPEPEYGPVRAGSRHYEAYRRLLRRTVDEPFALLLPG